MDVQPNVTELEREVNRSEHAVVRQLAREIGLNRKPLFVPAGRCPDTGNWIQAWWQHWQIIPKHGRQRYHTARFHIFQRKKSEICCWQIDHRFTDAHELTAASEAKILKHFESLPLDLVMIGRPAKFVGLQNV
jgi:hypothetical protein